jgi:cytochrome c nitrite reductase small subunit
MMSRLLAWIRTLATLAFLPTPWRWPTFLILGVAAGLGLVLVRVSEFPSYLSDSPRTCINCHIMVPQYATWQRSSHRHVTNCNDCHVPHENVVAKYAFKAKDGLRHAAVFTLRAEPQVIRATPESAEVIQHNCRRCHASQLRDISALHGDRARNCTDCHRETPHGQVHSLASTPHVPYPHLPPVTSWPYGKDW